MDNCILQWMEALIVLQYAIVLHCPFENRGDGSLTNHCRRGVIMP